MTLTPAACSLRRFIGGDVHGSRAMRVPVAPRALATSGMLQGGRVTGGEITVVSLCGLTREGESAFRGTCSVAAVTICIVTLKGRRLALPVRPAHTRAGVGVCGPVLPWGACFFPDPPGLQSCTGNLSLCEVPSFLDNSLTHVC